MTMVLIEALSSFSRIRYKFYARNLLRASIKNTRTTRAIHTTVREMSMMLFVRFSRLSRTWYKFYETNLLDLAIKNTCIAQAVYTRMKKVSFSLFFLTTPFSMFGKQVNPSRNLYILYQGKIPGFSKVELFVFSGLILNTTSYLTN